MRKKKDDRLLIWIEIAKSDLKSAQLLYKNGHYRNSYYFFQQASEKALKAFSLKHQFISEKEFQNIKHDIFKLFKAFLSNEEQKLISSAEGISANSDHLKKIAELVKNKNQFTEAKKIFDLSTNEEIINISLEDLNSMLREFKDSLFYNLNLPKIYGKKAKEKISTFLSWLEELKDKRSLNLKQIIESIMKDEETFRDLYEGVAKYLDASIGTLSAGYAILYCTLVTAKHNNLTRYPHQEWNPLNIYSRNLPIIKKQPEFMRILGRALKSISLIPKNARTSDS